jgi:hypothetical protein
MEFVEKRAFHSESQFAAGQPPQQILRRANISHLTAVNSGIPFTGDNPSDHKQWIEVVI